MPIHTLTILFPLNSPFSLSLSLSLFRRGVSSRFFFTVLYNRQSPQYRGDQVPKGCLLSLASSREHSPTLFRLFAAEILLNPILLALRTTFRATLNIRALFLLDAQAHRARSLPRAD